MEQCQLWINSNNGKSSAVYNEAVAFVNRSIVLNIEICFK